METLGHPHYHSLFDKWDRVCDYNISPVAHKVCSKDCETPAGVVCVCVCVGGSPGQCFVQLSDYKNAGYTGRGESGQ